MNTLLAYIATCLLIGAAGTARSEGASLATKETASSKTGALIFSAEGLPPGVSIDAQTGKISGMISRTAGWKNGDVFNVIVSFQNGDGASGMTKIDLRPKNSSPLAVDDAVILFSKAQSAIRLHAMENDHDPEGDPLHFVSARAGRGTVVTSNGGIMMYLPTGKFDDDVIVYQIGDGHGGVAAARVYVRASK